MKKWALFLIFILVIQIGYGIEPVLAESEKDTVAIKQVIENYWKGFIYRDSDLIMSQISTNYSSFDKEDKVVDYANLKSHIKSHIENIFKQYIDISINDLKITNLGIQGNKATVEIEYTSKAFSLEFAKDVSKKNRRLFSLTKEGDSWKIVQHLEVEPIEGQSRGLKSPSKP